MTPNFVKDMESAKKIKLDRRNRGETIGNYRGSLPARVVEDEPEWWLEAEFARIARGLAEAAKWFERDLEAAVLDLNGIVFDDCPF